MKTKYQKILSVFLLALSLPAFAQVAPSTGGGGGGGVATTPTVAPIAPTPVSSVTQIAGELPPTLPITSQELLISNAKRKVAKVAASVWTRGLVYGAPNTVTSFEKDYVPSIPNQPDFNEFLVLVNLTRFSFETRNPNDPVEVHVGFRDKNGRELFQGSQSFKLVKDANGNYAPPSSEIKVRVWPNGDLPIEVPGADWMELALLNEQGETSETRSLERDQRTGNFLFPLWLAGQQNVQVTAFDNRDDGTTVKAVYSASTGTQQPIVSTALRVSAALENVIVIQPETTLVILSPVTYNEFGRMIREGRSPLVQISYTKETKVALYAEYLGQVAKGFWVRRADVVKWSYHEVLNGSPAQLTVSPGIYDVIIDGLVNISQQTFGNNGGSVGKGSVTAVPAGEEIALQ